MRVHRQAHAIRALVVLAVLFGSLWACVLGASGPGPPVEQLITSRSLLGLEAGALPGRAAALHPPAERPDPGGGLLLPLLLDLAAAATVAYRVSGRRRQSSRPTARSPVLAALDVPGAG